MFTGIIEERGVVKGVSKSSYGLELAIEAKAVREDAKIGDSIAVNGVCLTVKDIKDDALCFDAIHETLLRTTLGALKRGSAVNLERSMRADSRFGGHFVTGHIDYKGEIKSVTKGSRGTGFNISLPERYRGFVIEKGSVAVDGISLTVAECGSDFFRVYLIPHTLKATTFSQKKTGNFVNVETDILARYAHKSQSPAIADILKKYDYI